METADLKKIIEALLYVSDHPVTLALLKNVLGDAADGQNIEQLVTEIGEEYAARVSPVELRFIAGGWQFATKKEFNPWIRKLYKEKTTLRLSKSALETLSVIAYKQPITRAEIEEIRGVETSGVIETILERKLVKIVGRKETLGRPLLYGTTQEFLRHFGLSHLSELPSLEEMAIAAESSDEYAADAVQELPLEEPVLSVPAESGVADDGATPVVNSDEPAPATAVCPTDEPAAVPVEEPVPVKP